MLAVTLLAALAAPEPPRFLHEASVQAVAFAPDGKTIASAGVDRTIRLWKTATGELIRTVGEHEGRVLTLTFSPDGKLLATAGPDLKVYLWDPDAGKVVRTLVGHTDTILAVGFSPDGKLLATASLDQTIRVWDAATGRVVRAIEYPEDRAPALAFSPDGREVYAGLTPSPKVRRYSVETGKPTREWVVHRNGDLTAVAVAGRWVFAGTAGGLVTRFDADNQAPPARVPTPGSDTCLSLAASPDGKLVLVGGGHGGLDLVEAATLQVVRSFGCRTQGFHVLDQQPTAAGQSRVRTVGFSPTTAFLVAGTEEGQLRVWRLTDLLSPKLATASRLTDAEVRAAWAAMSGQAEPAYQALARLAAYPEQALAFLSERQKPAPPVDAKQVRAWIAQLDDDDFAAREKAHLELRAVRKSAEALLREAHAGGKLPVEAARRVAELLEPLSPDRPDEDQLRDQRVVLLLQVIGTPEARKALEVLATGAATAPATADAKAALRRLDPR